MVARILLTLSFSSVCLFAGRASGQTLPTVPDLLESMQSNHPYVQVLSEKNNQLLYKLDSAESEFDLKLEQDISGRLAGYYDGSAASQRFIKPLGDMNAKLITEYRVATGDFPVYEEQYNTLSGGEASIGVALSLLQNRSIDKRRLGVSNARLSIEQYQAELTVKMNEFLYKGLSHYLKWYEVGLKISAVHSLLDTLKTRKEGLETRVKRGDLAEVTLTEFEASVLEQQLALSQLYQIQRTAAQALAYFWRDNEGQSQVIASDAAIPSDIHWPYTITPLQGAALRSALNRHPALSVIRTEQAVAQNNYRLAENRLLPKLDLKALVAKDMGSGPTSLAETEGKIGLSFSYTLGNRKAKAKQATLKSELRVLDYELTLAQDQLSQEFEQAYAYWQQANEVLALQRKNAELSVTLSQLERQRFDAGDSDMFKLNARESGVLKAKLKAIEAQVSLLEAELRLHRVVAGIMTSPELRG